MIVDILSRTRTSSDIHARIQAKSGNPTAQAIPHATHESHSTTSEPAKPELVAAAAAEEDEAGADAETTCDVIDGDEDECSPVLEVVFASPVLVVAPPVAAEVVFASLVAVSVVSDIPVVLMGPPGLSEVRVRIGSGFPVKWAVSRTHAPALQMYPATQVPQVVSALLALTSWLPRMRRASVYGELMAVVVWRTR